MEHQVNHLDDTHMAQIDAAATKRAQADDWHATKPTKHVERVTAALAHVLSADPEPAALMFREAEPMVPALTEYSVWITLADGVKRELSPVKAATLNEAHGMAIRAGIEAFRRPLTASVTPRRSSTSQSYGVLA